MDIRRLTCVIIQKDGRFLVGTIMGSQDLRWSNDSYDAWRTRSVELARKAAWITGGTMMLFNPAVGQLRKL